MMCSLIFSSVIVQRRQDASVRDTLATGSGSLRSPPEREEERERERERARKKRNEEIEKERQTKREILMALLSDC